jgi:hypothetical protein
MTMLRKVAGTFSMFVCFLQIYKKLVLSPPQHQLLPIGSAIRNNEQGVEALR